MKCRYVVFNVRSRSTVLELCPLFILFVHCLEYIQTEKDTFYLNFIPEFSSNLNEALYYTCNQCNVSVHDFSYS